MSEDNAKEKPRCGLRCAYDDGPCQQCIAFTEQDLLALDPLHDRLGADHDGALVPDMGRQPVMAALNLRGPGSKRAVQPRLFPVWRTIRRLPPTVIPAVYDVDGRYGTVGRLLKGETILQEETWIKEPVIDPDTGYQLWAEDDDQSGDTPIPGLLREWVLGCRGSLRLAIQPKDRSVPEGVRWLGIHLRRWLDACADPVGLCEQIRRAAQCARRVLRDFDPRPRLLRGAACPGRDDAHPCEALALYERPDKGPIDCGACGHRFEREDPRLLAAVEEALAESLANV